MGKRSMKKLGKRESSFSRNDEKKNLLSRSSSIPKPDWDPSPSGGSARWPFIFFTHNKTTKEREIFSLSCGRINISCISI